MSELPQQKLYPCVFCGTEQERLSVFSHFTRNTEVRKVQCRYCGAEAELEKWNKTGLELIGLRATQQVYEQMTLGRANW